MGTLLSVRAAACCSAFHARGIPWLNENPHEYDNEANLYKLDEFVDLCAKPGIKAVTIALCEYGSDSQKLTDFRGNIEAIGAGGHAPSELWRLSAQAGTNRRCRTLV